MFIGEYTHNIDTKRRVALPKKFRELLGDTVVVTRGLDKCLFVYSMNEWERLARKLSKIPMGEASNRSFVRIMLSGASDAELDSQGRILVPEYLKEYAGLTKNVIIVGLYDKLEIWDEDKWNKYKEKTEDDTEKIAEELGKLGIY